jgi:DNA-binding transcriptional regulator of glucitol operon
MRSDDDLDPMAMGLVAGLIALAVSFWLSGLALGYWQMPFQQEFNRLFSYEEPNK